MMVKMIAFCCPHAVIRTVISLRHDAVSQQQLYIYIGQLAAVTILPALNSHCHSVSATISFHWRVLCTNRRFLWVPPVQHCRLNYMCCIYMQHYTTFQDMLCTPAKESHCLCAMHNISHARFESMSFIANILSCKLKIVNNKN